MLKSKKQPTITPAKVLIIRGIMLSDDFSFFRGLGSSGNFGIWISSFFFSLGSFFATGFDAGFADVTAFTPGLLTAFACGFFFGAGAVFLTGLTGCFTAGFGAYSKDINSLTSEILFSGFTARPLKVLC